MAPPITKPRLSALKSHQVALEVASRALAEHEVLTVRLFAPAFTLEPTTAELEPEQRVRKTRIYKSIKRLADYAQQGGELDHPVREHLLILLPVIQRQLRAGAKASVPDPVDYPEPLDALIARMDTLQEDEPLAVVLRGAHAREILDTTDEPITASQLAVLASEARTRMSKLVSEGNPKGRKLRSGADSDQKRDNPFVIEKAEALRFLVGKDVPGFALNNRRARAR
jgi:hypothetical protein